MKAFFADTFYWIALTNTDDSAHQQALSLSRSLQPSKIITTENVLEEYLTYFSGARRSVREHAGDLVFSFIHNRRIAVVPQSHESFMAGLELYRARPDKGYSLTDCISMQMMRREGLTDALTNDQHFEQEGFRALFRS